MLKSSLEDEVKYGGKDLETAKKNLAAAAETKASAEGDLSVTSKDLGEDKKALSELHHNCMTKANDFEAEVKSRGEELKALATAKKIIKETTGGASDQSYGLDQESFLQMPEGETRAVRFIRQLAKNQKSPALAQLASRMSSTIRFSNGNQADIFAKVKGLIRDMIEKLEAEAEADATKKAYCDKELAETNTKKDDKTAEIEKLTAKIEQQAAQSAKLKEEVATLESELAALVREQAEMDKIRAEEKAQYEVNSAEMEKGLNGIKLALKVLNEYYAKADKAHDVKYKTKEATGLDKSNAELTSDKENVETELAAVNEYLKKVEDECIAKPETYEDRKARREAEIAGLKEALTVLESETAFIQKGSRTLRGTKRH